MKAKAFALALLIIALLLGCTAPKPEQRKVELQMYEVRVKPLSEDSVPRLLWKQYTNAPVVSSVVFNGYRISYEILFDGYEYRTPTGEVYTARMVRRENGQVVGTGKRAKLLVLRMNFEKAGEPGMPPPTVTKASPLMSLLLFGGLIPVEKKLVLTEVTTYLGLGDNYAAQWNLAISPETTYLCSFDTNSTVEKGFGVCLFTYPEDKSPKEIIVSLSGVREPGYVVARIPISDEA